VNFDPVVSSGRLAGTDPISRSDDPVFNKSIGNEDL
jgi:hypothetical protein